MKLRAEETATRVPGAEAQCVGIASVVKKAPIVAVAPATFRVVTYVPVIDTRVLAYKNSGNVLFT
ncbi:hypothetical protein PBS_10150 [Paraburkholderia sp. 2C]